MNEIGRESALLPIITIKLQASIGEKSTSKKPIHADSLLTKHFNPQMNDFIIKYSSAFCEPFIFSFLFHFLSYIVTGAKKGSNKE